MKYRVELLRLDAVELKFWRRHFGAIETVARVGMLEKAEMFLDPAIIPHGVVEEESVVVGR
jgi:hypothetical protein